MYPDIKSIPKTIYYTIENLKSFHISIFNKELLFYIILLALISCVILTGYTLVEIKKIKTKITFYTITISIFLLIFGLGTNSLLKMTTQPFQTKQKEMQSQLQHYLENKVSTKELKTTWRLEKINSFETKTTNQIEYSFVNSQNPHRHLSLYDKDGEPLQNKKLSDVQIGQTITQIKTVKAIELSITSKESNETQQYTVKYQPKTKKVTLKPINSNQMLLNFLFRSEDDDVKIPCHVSNPSAFLEKSYTLDSQITIKTKTQETNTFLAE